MNQEKLLMNFLETIYKTGLAYHRRGDLALASVCYEKVLSIKPDHADAWYFLGVIALTQGEYLKAIELIEKAMAFDQTKAAYFNGYGIALRETFRYDDAILAFRQAIRLNSNYADAWANLGQSQLDIKRFADAEQSLHKAILLAPKHSTLTERYWKAFDKELNRLLETNATLNWRTVIYDRFFPAAKLMDASSSCHAARENFGKLLGKSFPHVKPKLQYSPHRSGIIRLGFVVIDGFESEFFHAWQQVINNLQRTSFEILIFCPSSRYAFCQKCVNPETVKFVLFTGSFDQIATMIRNEECDVIVYYEADTSPWDCFLAMTRPARIQLTTSGNIHKKSMNPSIDRVISRSVQAHSIDQWNEFFKNIVFAESQQPDSIQQYPTITHGDDFAKDRAVMEYLEINLTYGCNLACEHCTHFCKYSRGIEPLENIIEWYDAWHDKIAPKNIRLIGGKPLLYSRLCEAIDATSRYWPETNLMMTTNGLLLENANDKIIDKLREKNIHVFLSQHYNDEDYTPVFFRGIDRLIRTGIRYTIYTSYMNWRKMYHVDSQGTLLPYQSNHELAWQNCQTKNICPTLLNNRLYKCQHIAHVFRCRREGILNEHWDLAACYQPLDEHASMTEIRDHLYSEAVPACGVCPERYEFVDLETKRYGYDRHRHSTFDEFEAPLK